MDERAGDRDALLLTAGERIGAAFLAALEADFIDDGERASVGFVVRATLNEQRHHHVLHHGERGDEIE